MTADIFLAAAATRHVAGLNGATAMPESAGKLLGHRAVSLESPLSLLRNAAEELSSAVDLTDDFELEERKERDSGDAAARKLAKLYRQCIFPAEKNGELHAFRLDLQRESTQTQGKDFALHAALRRFPDPSDAWAALDESRNALEAAGDTQTLAAVNHALDTLDRTQGQRIRAGMQGVLASAGHRDVDSAVGLRNFYRDTVCDFSSVNEVFSHILEQYGALRMEKALDFLSDALGRDMASDLPSLEPAHLVQINTGLGQVHLLQSAYGLCDTMMARWENVHGVKGVRDGSLSPQELLGRLVALRQEKFVGSVHVGRITADAKIPDIEHEVLFLQELLGTVRTFPSQLFDDDAGRMRVLNAVQQAVDSAVEKEDAWLATH